MHQSKLSLFIRSYWDYYLDLEDEFLQTKKYVDFDVYNKNTYSVEFLKLMQAVCSEVDAVAKEVASSLESTFKIDNTTNIKKWGFVLQNKLPQILTTEVVFNHSIRVIPWENWMYEQYRDKNNTLKYRLKGNSKTPSWWLAYNDVKHQRTRLANNGHANYTKANLMNLIRSYAALYVLESEYINTMYGDQEPTDGIKNSKLFQQYYDNFKDLIY